jgi:hypothetical protein
MVVGCFSVVACLRQGHVFGNAGYKLQGTATGFLDADFL